MLTPREEDKLFRCAFLRERYRAHPAAAEKLAGPELEFAERWYRPCGDSVKLGVCPVCGRSVTKSSCTRDGATCRKCGARFNRNGVRS